MGRRAGRPNRIGQQRRACTCFAPGGVQRCGRVDACTKVTIFAGGKKIVRWACSSCRRRNKLNDRGETTLRAS